MGTRGFHFILSICLFIVTQIAAADIVSDSRKRANDFKLSDELVQRIDGIEEVAKARVEPIERYIGSKGFKDKLNQYSRGTQKLMGFQTTNGDGQDSEIRLSGERFILFVSSSMPLSTLRNYASDLVKIDGIMIFRGLVGDPHKMKPTIDLFRRIMADDEECLTQGCDLLPLKAAIDPKRFRQYQVSQVPAGLLENAPSFEPNCNEGTQYSPNSGVVYGDASIVAMLNTLDPHRKDTTIQRYIAILEGRENVAK